MPSILFIAAHRPGRSPSQRFRFEQYFGFLRQHGFRCDLSYLISEKDDNYFYSPGNFLYKISLFFKSRVKRKKDVRHAKDHDIVFVQREAFMTGSVYFEKKFKESGAKLVFDFDDAIWHLDVSEGNKRLSWLKNPGKTAELISMSDLVIAGNDYLADYARHHNPNVMVIPTTIDTALHVPMRQLRSKEKVVIGWSGSITTVKHFELAENVLRKLKEKYRDAIELRVVGDRTYSNAALGVNGMAWSAEKEVELLNAFDIGIMPLPDDEWSKGKCGLKGLSYMACEVPPVLAAVGVNNEIVKDGVNGYLARTEDEWFERLCLLIGSKELRERMGREARRTVIEKYSVESQKQRYLEAFGKLL